MTSSRARLTRAERAARANELAESCGGVAHRADLRAVGVSRDDIRSEVRAGRWAVLGRHTVAITGAGELSREAMWHRAVWESGSGAVLDGGAALCAAGVKGFTPWRLDVTIPHANRHHRVDGVRLHRPASLPPAIGNTLRRVVADHAALRTACWARTEREAALVVCLVVQQRLTSPARLLDTWESGSWRSPLRPFVGTVVRDVCDGAQALGELDFGRLCRRAGLPPPTRQIVRWGPRGRIYLDAGWEDVGLFVEIDGGHHLWALNPVEDALRQNAVALGGDLVLRLPLMGLRIAPGEFMGQVVLAHRRLTAARAS